MSKNVTRRMFLQSAALSSLAAATSNNLKLGTAALTPAPLDEKSAAARGSTQFVDVFIATGGHGHCYPGATTPFGMVQLSPDTGVGDWDHCSGYHHDDTSIMGFSHTHLSGTGAADLLDILLMPGTGPARIDPGPKENPTSGYRSRFSHSTERGEPGYYTVYLEDPKVLAELTATPRVGLHRYTFPADPTSHFILDLAHGTIDPPQRMYCNVITAELHVVSNDTITGGRRVQEWAPGRYIYFAMKFSKPFAGVELMADSKSLGATARDAEGKFLKAIIKSPTTAHEQILVKVGLSAVSIDGALRNLETELPGWDFNGVRDAACAMWERELSKITIESNRADSRCEFFTYRSRRFWGGMGQA